MKLRHVLIASAITTSLVAPAVAQRRPPTPEQRIDRLERGLRQVQERVYGRNPPADTAGFPDDPAVTQSSLAVLVSRLDSIERQMAEAVRTGEENNNRVATLEAEVARMRAELQRRPAAVEEPAADTSDDSVGAVPAVSSPQVEQRDPAPRSVRQGDPDFATAGEEAYDRGYQLWLQKRYDQSITALRAMASSFPGHRRVSWANNLAGRALLDKGEYRAAAEALLANYRSNPQGERAADSLFYLGQASFKLRQPQQACRAYAELENVYGSTLRTELRRLLPAAKAEANCS
jgi:TolA-binding protein